MSIEDAEQARASHLPRWSRPVANRGGGQNTPQYGGLHRAWVCQRVTQKEKASFASFFIAFLTL